MTSRIALDQVRCRYNGQIAVRDVSFTVAAGEIVSLLGPSGCGKTTILRAIAGLESVQAGSISLRGRSVSTTKGELPTEKRQLGMVTQDYALFPHLTALENASFGLHKKPRQQRKPIAEHWLDWVGMHDYADRYPHELSGGQQQRIALARSLAPEPDILLLDEPFASLDLELRERLAGKLRELLQANGATGLVVTHDQHEAFALADQIGVMQQGEILQWDTPHKIYHEPANRFVADFVGQGRLLPGTLIRPNAVRTAIGDIEGEQNVHANPGALVDVLLRPDDLIPDEQGSIQGRVIKRAFKGADILYTLRLDTDDEVLALFPSHVNPELGSNVRLRLAAEHLVAFPRQ